MKVSFILFGIALGQICPGAEECLEFCTQTYETCNRECTDSFCLSQCLRQFDNCNWGCPCEKNCEGGCPCPLSESGWAFCPENETGYVDDSIEPLTYNVNLRLWLDPENQGEHPAEGDFHFDGETTFFFKPRRNTDYLILNFYDLHFSEIKVVNLNSIYKLEGQRIYVAIPWHDGFKAGIEYRLEAKYFGYMRPNNYGLYLSQYDDDQGRTHYLAGTQFEDEGARRVFPCIDQPNAKAEFRLNVTHERDFEWTEGGISYWANTGMPGFTYENPEGSGVITTEFSKTVKMSTYLLAITVTDFVSIDTSSVIDQIPMAHSYRPEYSVPEFNRDDVAFHAAECGNRALDVFGRRLGVYYGDMGIPKIDQTALPDFSAGAMENWGLVLYREVSMLYNRTSDRTSTKHNICLTVSHELAHQWWGNHVTCDTWEEIWLNEAFATIFQYIGVEYASDLDERLNWEEDSQIGTWDLDDWFIIGEMMAGLETDASVMNSQPLLNKENTWNLGPWGPVGIIYRKGASILSMMRDNNVTVAGNSYEKKYTAGESVQSICKDLKEAGGVRLPANGSDFYSYFDTFEPYIKQMGYPLLTVDTDLIDGDTYVKFTQQRWVGSEDENNIADQPPNVPPSPLLRNSRRKILDQLSSDKDMIPKAARAKLIADYFAFAENVELTGRDITNAFEVAKFASEETEKLVWDVINSATAYTSTILRFTENKSLLDDYMQVQVRAFYDLYGNAVVGNDAEHLAMERALGVACKFGLSECVSDASTEFNLFVTRVNGVVDYENEPMADRKESVYCYGIEVGTQDQWRLQWSRYATASSNEQAIIRRSLACTKDPVMVQVYLQLSTQDDIRLQDKHYSFVALAKGLYSRDDTWAFVKTNWDYFYNMIVNEGWTRVGLIIDALAESWSTEEDKQDLQAFYEQLEKEDRLANLKKTFENALITVQKNIDWRSNYESKLVDWLTEN
ncbi:Oidioi.mRNA.OKI2018_I69.PAR.g11352.t1.cds [Oikopleura dioica]|uniref:Aminopeptidase n=1 Tax=Oikopleura dioica TaxID=34765 RepID=A0ABN7RV72_OIKDI|nr:Oidioi.mRNA.OKI2018_I69.PAR.g11352.t1.cds [Oikopleura dioica]